MNLLEHPMTLWLDKTLSNEKSIPCQVVLGAMPIQGAVSKTKTPGVYQIANPVQREENGPTFVVPTYFTADKVVAITVLDKKMLEGVSDNRATDSGIILGH